MRLICGPPPCTTTGLSAAQFEHHHVAGEFARQIGIDHGVAAILDDDDLIVIALQEGQRFRQDAGGFVERGCGFGHGLRF